MQQSTNRRGLGVGRVTVERVRKRFVERGVEAINDEPRPGIKPILGTKAEARLIAKACTAAPEGHRQWILQLLANRVVLLLRRTRVN